MWPEGDGELFQSSGRLLINSRRQIGRQHHRSPSRSAVRCWSR
ncbi:hypothetical protein BN903_202 [Halorubrum sp. AJ67]|nr:hypothetical protein BN903_202 [Halorubrum sp. AJ67]